MLCGNQVRSEATKLHNRYSKINTSVFVNAGKGNVALVMKEIYWSFLLEPLTTGVALFDQTISLIIDVYFTFVITK